MSKDTKIVFQVVRCQITKVYIWSSLSILSSLSISLLNDLERVTFKNQYSNTCKDLSSDTYFREVRAKKRVSCELRKTQRVLRK